MIPHEKGMVERLENRPFALLGINSDQDRAVLNEIQKADPPLDEKQKAARIHEANLAYLNKILKEQGIRWRQAAVESTTAALPTLWNVRGWPTIYVLDASGRIRFKDLRDQELEDAVRKLLDELEKPAGK